MQKIVDVFMAGNSRQAHLIAQMQSGKSGIFLGLAIRMLHMGLVDNVHIMCGSNEVELHEQLTTSWANLRRHYSTQLFASAATTAKLWDAVKIYKSTGADGIKKMPADMHKSLLIWDEAHFAQGTNNLPAKKFEAAGLLVSGTAKAHATWVEKDSYFLAVSATPFAAIAAFHDKERIVNHVAQVWHTPAACYKGIKDLRPQFQESFSIKSYPERFKELLDAVGPHKYILVRSHNLAVVKAICEERGLAFEENTHKQNLDGGLDSLKNEPALTTVIGMIGKCRMGKVVPKRFIGMTFEESQATNTDSILQSFIGRMCGHDSPADPYPDTMPLIFVPKKFFEANHGISECERVERFFEGESILPQRAAHVEAAPSTLATRTGKFSIVPLPIHTAEDEDEFADLSAMEALDRLTGRFAPRGELALMLINRVRHVLQTALMDEMQRQELLVMCDAAHIEFRDINCYDAWKDSETGIEACANKNIPFDDDWNAPGKCIKIYRMTPGRLDRLYVTARTAVAEYDNQMEQLNAMPKAKVSTIFLRDDAEAPPEVHPLVMIDTEADLAAFTPSIVGKIGIHTAFIHPSLRDSPLMKELKERSKAGRGGKYLPKAHKGTDYIRIMIEIKVVIEIKATVSVSIEDV